MLIAWLLLGARLHQRAVGVATESRHKRTKWLSVHQHNVGVVGTSGTYYEGPPPPASGTVHLMYCSGILMEQHLQWTQFCALMTNSSPCRSIMEWRQGEHRGGEMLHTSKQQPQQPANSNHSKQRQQHNGRAKLGAHGTSGYSYTPAGQNLVSGAPWVLKETFDGTCSKSG